MRESEMRESEMRESEMREREMRESEMRESEMRLRFIPVNHRGCLPSNPGPTSQTLKWWTNKAEIRNITKLLTWDTRHSSLPVIESCCCCFWLYFLQDLLILFLPLEFR
ncbi:hypothetical protein Pmani_039092 [Petrolisthes manimaculis]|uniref:Uncharacterized protein n=1 Tax=Petrolisthes manimaculis TaxID=1843537 RepID=A0AAE1ND67_9EUCA|nr:hypothetical protein Pmani_039092 [Petrolisthes manimaculis]